VDIKRLILVIVGSAIAASGLQFFLIPNNLLDGGVTGISIISSYVAEVPLALFLVIFNIPFVYLGYKRIGKYFAVYSVFGILMLALLTLLVHPMHGITEQPLLAAVFGGILVGIGAGVAIRYGGTLDGGDTVAVLLDKVSTFSVGEIIMAFNAVILTISGFVFGWDHAMYSIIAYFVAHKAIDVTVEGLNESRSVWIVSRHYKVIGKAVEQQIGRKVTYFKDNNPLDGHNRGILLSVITRFEEQRIKRIIHQVDPKAFIVIGNAHEIIGKHFTR
jgi:uncharacterized membrane-anchored protein YitT (DUF2179 family)